MLNLVSNFGLGFWIEQNTNILYFLQAVAVAMALMGLTFRYIYSNIVRYSYFIRNC